MKAALYAAAAILGTLLAGCAQPNSMSELSNDDEFCRGVGRPSDGAEITEMNAAQALCYRSPVPLAPLPNSPSEPSVAEPVTASYHCDAGEARVLVGQVPSAEIGLRALKLGGARTIRWMQPGADVTLEYRDDRLNIHVENGRVTDINCG